MRCASMASFWTLLEVSRLYVLCGFPFNSTGLVMTSHPMMMQMAALFGIYGLSFWVIFTSSIGVKAFVQKSIGYSCLWVALLVSPLVFGFFHMNYHDKKALLQNHLAVALIQTGLEVEQKWPFPKHEETYIDPFIQWKMIFDMLSSTQHKAYDLIVLPEVALPGNAYYPDIDYERALRDIIKEDSRLPALIEPLAARDSKGNWKVSHAWMAQAIANRFKSELVVGLLDVDDELEESYNSAFHFVPFRTSIHRYEKRVLVPLAEYLPLPVMKSFLEEYGITSFFTPGKKAKVFYGNVPLAVSICYEEGYSNLIREARILGAKLLVNVTNDGWFPKSRLPQEHYNLGVLRSIENGVPVVRACNTGITAAIDSLGRVQGVMQDVGKDGETLGGVVTASLGLYSYTTLFSIAGNNLIVLISTLVLLLFFFYRKPLSF